MNVKKWIARGRAAGGGSRAVAPESVRHMLVVRVIVILIVLVIEESGLRLGVRLR